MSEPLLDAFTRAAEGATTWRDGEDPGAVLEALAFAAALEIVGILGEVPRSARDGLRRVGQRALLQSGGGGSDVDEDDADAFRLACALARDGLRALSGRPPRDGAVGDVAVGDVAVGDVAVGDVAVGDVAVGDVAVGDVAVGTGHPSVRLDAAAVARALVPSRDLARLISGELDGFAAAGLAQRVRRSPEAMEALGVLVRASRERGTRSADGPLLQLAAAGVASVLDPARGRAVGALAELGAEAVLFDMPDGARRLAVYAEEPHALRLVSPDLRTEDVREGYWVGRVADGASRVDATLEIGERTVEWTIELPSS